MTAPENQPIADVCLVLEGTYPYVLGGVSSWVDQIIKGLPDLKFALFFIGSKKEEAQKILYQLPPNVVSLTEHYLHDRLSEEELCPGDPPAALRARVYRALRLFYLAKGQAAQIKAFWDLAEALRAAGDDYTFGNLLRDQEAWEVLQDVYDAFAPGESFIDFFWTSRFLHLPIWSLWKALPRVPRAKLYHSISTGYAGFLGALAARFTQLPYLITEHGIYTKERLAEISQADWIYEPDNYQINYSEGLGKLKQMWMAMFTFVGQVAYHEADQIITLYEGNTYVQIEFGADSKKLAVIPNGIEPSRFDAIYKGQMERWQSSPPVKSIGFIGRIVPIKDVKTLVRAARFVCDRMPEARFLLAGPFAENPAYFDECQKIAKLLHIEDKVQFMGMQKIMEVLPQMDLLVLTSISEGLPLVCLEGMAAGLPQVATDVGACRELIFGRTPEDRALGRAGRLTKILSPQETASALITLLRNPALMRECGKAGRDRAEQFYSMRSMLQGYRDLYAGLMLAGKTPPKEAPPLPEPVQITPSTPLPFGRKSRAGAAPVEESAPERDEPPPGDKSASFGKRVREKPKAN